MLKFQTLLSLLYVLYLGINLIFNFPRKNKNSPHRELCYTKYFETFQNYTPGSFIRFRFNSITQYFITKTNIHVVYYFYIILIEFNHRIQLLLDKTF